MSDTKINVTLGADPLLWILIFLVIMTSCHKVHLIAMSDEEYKEYKTALPHHLTNHH